MYCVIVQEPDCPGKKVSLVLFFRPFCLWGLKRLLLGWNGSNRIFLALFNPLESAMSSREGRVSADDLLRCCYDPLQDFALGRAASKTHCNAVGQHVFHCGLVECLSRLTSRWHLFSSLKKCSLCCALLTNAAVLVFHLRSSATCTPRNLKEDTLSTQMPFICIGAGSTLFLLRSITIFLVLLVFSSRLFP